MNEKAEKKIKTFADLVKSITSVAVAEKKEPEGVKSEIIEWYGRQMARLGYQMTEWSVGVLSDYLKGYNLWLCGNVGVGKTYFFDVMNRIRIFRKMDKIVKLSMMEAQAWTMEDARNWSDENQEYDILLDDVGTEPVEMVSYGQRADLFPYLLERRMQLRGKRTHLTTNLKTPEIRKRYGIRVSDRFAQFFKFCLCPYKESRRSGAAWVTPKNGGFVP